MQRVLIIDDECLDREEEIRESFAGQDVNLILCSTKEDALEWINRKILVDCIVLDWFLEDPESPILSMQILKELQGKYFVPVLIYTAHVENYRAAKQGGEITYPDNMIREVSKLNCQNIQNIIQSWLSENCTARLSSVYFSKIYGSIHKVFCRLINIPHGNIADVYRKVIFENGHIDWSHDFIINLLLQDIVSDERFRGDISNLISSLPAENQESTEGERKLVLNKILYYNSHSLYLSNGDLVVVIKDDITRYGVIITPDCDLVQKYTKYVELIELVQLGSMRLLNSDSSISGNNNNNYYYLPGVLGLNDTFVDLAAVYKSKIHLVSADNDGEKYPGVRTRLQFSGSYLYDNSACRIQYICSLSNPYKSEFMQKKNTHDSRVGIPEIYKYLEGV